MHVLAKVIFNGLQIGFWGAEQSSWVKQNFFENTVFLKNFFI